METAEWKANSVDRDQMLHSVAYDLGLRYLLRPVCSNTSKSDVHYSKFYTLANPKIFDCSVDANDTCSNTKNLLVITLYWAS